MTDRELLKLAAIACGELKGGWIGNENYFDGVLGRWNPLDSDGDALRLAVKLKMDLRCMGSRCYAKVPLVTELADVFDYADHYAATRRAIVRAAAEIGKGM